MPQVPQLTREQIKAFLKEPTMQRAYDALQRAIRTMPDDLAAAIAAAAAAQADADTAQAAADAAQATADDAVADAAAALAALIAHAALTSTHGVAGAIVGTTDAQILSAKTLDGATPLTGQTVGTGGTTPVLTANKPGASTDVATWWTVSINGTSYLIPLFSPS